MGLVALVALAGPLFAGCGTGGDRCVAMAGGGELVARAGLVRIDVYDQTAARCDGARVQAGAPLPGLSRTFRAGEALTLDVPPGPRTLVLSTFADAEGRTLTGTACVEADLKPGGRPCLPLTVAASGGDCGTAPDSCPAGQYCAPDRRCVLGCKSDADCGTKKCDPAGHSCVGCLANTDCPDGQRCSPSGNCATGCAETGVCAGGLACCEGLCADPMSDRLHCGGCGLACPVGQECCGGACVDLARSLSSCGLCGRACGTDHGAPSCAQGACTWTCEPGFGHCASGTSGCETALISTSHCGGCGQACALTNASAASCDGTACGYTCATGYGDCERTGANLDGCETKLDVVAHCGGCGRACETTHSLGAACVAGGCTYAGCPAGRANCDTSAGDLGGCECATPACCAGGACETVHANGLGQSYYDCGQLGQPGSSGRYSLTMAQAARTASILSGTDGTVMCTGNADCLKREGAAACAVWCYTKSLAGYVSSGATCACPTTASPTWN